MWIYIIPILKFFVCFFAGKLNANMDLIGENILKYFLGNYYSAELSGSNKDRNNDGHIGIFEKNFPNDGWHRSKNGMVILLAINAGLSFCLGVLLYNTNINWVVVIFFLDIIASAYIFSLGFYTRYERYRRLYKELNK